MKNLSVKQMIGLMMITLVLGCTILGILGVWGIIGGSLLFQLVVTLVVVSVGLGTIGGMLDKFFRDPPPKVVTDPEEEEAKQSEDEVRSLSRNPEEEII